jgi:hypothetical protein
MLICDDSQVTSPLIDARADAMTYLKTKRLPYWAIRGIIVGVYFEIQVIRLCQKTYSSATQRTTGLGPSLFALNWKRQVLPAGSHRETSPQALPGRPQLPTLSITVEQ